MNCAPLPPLLTPHSSLLTPHFSLLTPHFSLEKKNDEMKKQKNFIAQAEVPHILWRSQRNSQ